MDKPVVIGLFLGVILVILLPEAFRKLQRKEVIGTPPINAFLFFTGKVLMILSWSFMFAQAAGVDAASINLPEVVSWVATALLCGGVFVVAISILQLGESTRMGLPIGKTALRTRGLYAFSRNPLYVGAYLMGVASCMYAPNVINLVATTGFILIHHRIVLAEERFLREQFGEEWAAYVSTTRRYL